MTQLAFDGLTQTKPCAMTTVGFMDDVDPSKPHCIRYDRPYAWRPECACGWIGPQVAVAWHVVKPWMEHAGVEW